MSRRVRWLLLAGALLVGLAARLPGVAWGENFPYGWNIHHPDEWTHVVLAETMLDPSQPARWQHPYPKGMAAMTLPPLLVANAAEGQIKRRPPVSTITTVGRLVSVLYGVGTILLLVPLADRLFRDRRVGIAGAWILALGGLHVSQSHMFVSDVAGIFWALLGTYLLLRDMESPDDSGSEFLRWGAAAFGAAFGMKLVMTTLPTLGLVALARGRKVRRVASAAMFFVGGFALINLGAYDIYELMKTLRGGTGDPYVFNRFMGAVLHVIELPRLVSFPVAILGVVGAVALGRRLLAVDEPRRRRTIWLVVLLPILVHTALLLAVMDHFPRHLIPYIPWLALTAGWCLVSLADRARGKGIPSAAVYAPVLLYLAAFVYDGERVYLDEPRNEAARWVEANTEPGSGVWWRRHVELPGRPRAIFPNQTRPPTVVIEMLDANHYLNGVNFRDSYPQDTSEIHDTPPPEWLEKMQSLFRGETEYREAARFPENYFMPEYTWIGRLLSDRSRNYVCEIVIFTKG